MFLEQCVRRFSGHGVVEPAQLCDHMDTVSGSNPEAFEIHRFISHGIKKSRNIPADRNRNIDRLPRIDDAIETKNIILVFYD